MRTLGRLVVIVIVLGILVGVVFYLHPLGVMKQETHFGLFLSRVQSNYVLTPEGRVHYYEAEPGISGGGIPLVLIHGLGARDEDWAPMLKRLKRAGFHVYAPDLLGYGRSPKPQNGDYSIAGEEKFAYDFIQSIGLQKTDVGGWSMGGWIALKLALDHPDVVDRVVVYDGVGLRFDLSYATTIFHPQNIDDVERLFTQMDPEMHPFSPFVRRDMLRKMQSQQWVVDRSVASMLTGRDLVDSQLASLSEPLLVVWGSEDHLVPVSVGERMHSLVPNSELDILEGCGHLAPGLCSSRAAQATADFLKANPLPAGSVRTLRAMHSH